MLQCKITIKPSKNMSNVATGVADTNTADKADNADRNDESNANIAEVADMDNTDEAATNDASEENVACDAFINDVSDENVAHNASDVSDVSNVDGASDISDSGDYSETDESLEYLPMERWGELEKAFEADWPRGVSALAALQTQRHIEELGLGYGFKVYCPHGVPKNGMVALHNKAHMSEIFIQCPHDDTSILEEALADTEIIDWENFLNFIPYMPLHIAECVAKVAKQVGFDMKVEDTDANEIFVLDNKTPVFEIDSLQNGMTFQPLSEKDLQIIDPTVCQDLCGGAWTYFRMLCQAKLTHGLYINQELVCWIFGNEVGSFARLCAAEGHKVKGYEELLLKLYCNSRLEAGRHVLAYCHKDDNSCELYEKLGFKRSHEVRFFSMFKPKK